jgi:hypothetical protein
MPSGALETFEVRPPTETDYPRVIEAVHRQLASNVHGPVADYDGPGRDRIAFVRYVWELSTAARSTTPSGPGSSGIWRPMGW